MDCESYPHENMEEDSEDKWVENNIEQLNRRQDSLEERVEILEKGPEERKEEREIEEKEEEISKKKQFGESIVGSGGKVSEKWSNDDHKNFPDLNDAANEVLSGKEQSEETPSEDVDITFGGLPEGVDWDIPSIEMEPDIEIDYDGPEYDFGESDSDAEGGESEG